VFESRFPFCIIQENVSHFQNGRHNVIIADISVMRILGLIVITFQCIMLIHTNSIFFESFTLCLMKANVMCRLLLYFQYKF